MRRRLRLAALLVSTLLSACTKTETVDASTQIMLRISSSDQALLDGLSQLRVAVALREEDGWKEPVSETFGSAELHWPVDIPITPRVHADAFKQFQVVIEALHEQSVLARVLMISGFVPDQRRVLEAVLYTCPEHADGCSPADCRGELCATCGMDGVCKPVVPTDPQLLAPLTPHAGGAGEATEAGPDADAGDAGESVPDAMPDGNVTPEMACNASCPSNAECVGSVCRDRCTGACDPHAACSVLDGNVHCECSGSYTGDGKSCTLTRRASGSTVAPTPSARSSLAAPRTTSAPV